MSGATWLVSYPRSGNTWVRFALMAALGGQESPGFEQLDKFARAVLDRSNIDWLMEADSGYLTEDETVELRAEYHRARFAGVSPSPIVKVHDMWQILPNGGSMHDAGFTHSAIYLIRDPRDVAVSWAAFMGRPIDWAIRFLANPDAHVGQRRDGCRPVMPEHLGSWSDHVLSWVDNAPFPVTVVRYEDMLVDPAACLTRMLDVIGHRIEATAIVAAVAASRFDRMAALEREHGFKDRPESAERFFRAGKSQDWLARLTPDQAAAITSAHRAVMKRFGYLSDDEEVALDQLADKL